MVVSLVVLTVCTGIDCVHLSTVDKYQKLLPLSLSPPLSLSLFSLEKFAVSFGTDS